MIDDLTKLHTDKEAQLSERMKTMRLNMLNPDSVEKICKKIKQSYTALNKPNFPKDGICSHLGFGFRIDDYYIDTHFESTGNLVLSIKPPFSQYLRTYKTFELPKERIELFRKALSQQFKVKIDPPRIYDGVYMIFNIDVPCPKSVQTAIKNYSTIKDVFNWKKEEECRAESFCKWAIKNGLNLIY